MKTQAVLSNCPDLAQFLRPLVAPVSSRRLTDGGWIAVSGAAFDWRQLHGKYVASKNDDELHVDAATDVDAALVDGDDAIIKCRHRRQR